MRRLIPILTVVLTLTLTAAVMACPMCKDSIANSDAQQPGGLPGGFNTTIYLMLGGFFAVVGLVTTTLVRGARTGGSTRGGRGFPL